MMTESEQCQGKHGATSAAAIAYTMGKLLRCVLTTAPWWCSIFFETHGALGSALDDKRGWQLNAVLAPNMGTAGGRNMGDRERCDCFDDVDDTLEPPTSLENTCKIYAVEHGAKRNLCFTCRKHGNRRVLSVYSFEHALWTWSAKFRKPLWGGGKANGSGRAA